MGKFYMKKHVSGEGSIVAVCDEEILGKVFREGDLVLEVSESFYGGELVDEREALEQIRIADMAVLAGNRIVSLAIQAGLVHRDAVIRISDQLHAQIMRW